MRTGGTDERDETESRLEQAHSATSMTTSQGPAQPSIDADILEHLKTLLAAGFPLDYVLEDERRNADPAERIDIEVDDEDDDEDDALEQARMLRITRMPQSFTVKESEAGRAFGQWVMAVRCECGRRWFEVEAVYQAHCPRCGKLVFIEFDLDASED